MKAKRTRARLGRILLAVASVGLLLVLLPFVAVSIRPVREEALRRTLARLSDSLPGQLALGSSHWPGFSRLELIQARWLDDARTLASVDTLELEFEPFALLHRDVHVVELRAVGLSVDLPRLKQTLAAHASSRPERPKQAAVEPFLPRWGSLPPVPSIAVSRLRIAVSSLVLAPEDTLAGALDLAIELRQGRDPRLDGRIRVTEPNGVTTVLRVRSPAEAGGAIQIALADTLGQEWTHLELMPHHARRLLTEPWAFRLQSRLPPPGGWASIPALERVLEAEKMPADGRLHLRAEGTVAPDSLLLSVRLDARAPSLELDSLQTKLRARLQTGHAPRARLGLRLHTRGLQVQQDYRLLQSAPLQLAATALRVSAQPGAAETSGEDTFDARLGADGQGGWSIHDLSVEGAFGRGRLDARLPAREIWTARLHWSWEEPPAILDRLPRSLAESLRRGPWNEAQAQADLGLRYDPTTRSTWHATLRGRLPGTRLTARVESIEDELQGAGTVEIDASSPLLSMASLGDSLSAQLKIDWTARGRASAPSVEARIEGHAHSRLLAIPRLRGSLQIDRGLPRGLELIASGALRYRSMALRKLSLQWRPEARDPLPSWFALEAGGKDFTLAQVLRLSHEEDTWVAEIDTLGLRWKRKELHNRTPLRVRVDTRARRAELEALDLDGSLGHIEGALAVTPQAAQGTLDLVLTPPTAARLDLPQSLPWPGRVRAHLRLDPDSLRVDASAAGFSLAGRTHLTVEAAVHADRDSTVGHISLSDSTAALLEGLLRLPLGLGDSLLGFRERPGTRHLRVDVHDLPLPTVSRWKEYRALQLPRSGDRDVLHLHGWLLADGRGDTTHARADLRLVPSDGAAGPGTARIAALWGSLPSPPDAVPSWVGTDTLLLELWRAHQDRSLDLRMSVGDSLQSRFFGLAHLPLELKDTEVTRTDGELRLRILTDDLDLARFEAFLPIDAFLEGRLWMDLRAEGPWDDPRLQGTLHTEDLQTGVPRRARAQGDVDLRMEGSLNKPALRGSVVLDQAQIRIPQRITRLHPTKGSSLVWEAARADSVALRPPAGQAPDDRQRSPDEPERPEGDIALPPGLDLKIDVDVPRNLWIRGRGLDVRLTGHLILSQVDGRLDAHGNLETTEGSFSFMNKTFRLRRGEVAFYGDPMDPSLDIEMGITVSQADITVHITGSTSDPQLDFQSSPAMDEADIFSYLLFGGPSARLDQAGVDLVQQQAVNAVEAFAIPQLESGVGEQLGISMIQLKQDEDQDQGLSLVVGKYITPQVLLKYEQSLSEGQSHTVHLEYWINRYLSLQTFYSERKQSGVELRVRKDY